MKLTFQKELFPWTYCVVAKSSKVLTAISCFLYLSEISAPVHRYFCPLLLNKLLQLSQIWRVPTPDDRFHLLPQSFLKDICCVPVVLELKILKPDWRHFRVESVPISRLWEYQKKSISIFLLCNNNIYNNCALQGILSVQTTLKHISK